MEGHYIINSNFEDLYNSDDAITLKVTGIIRGKEDKKTLSEKEETEEVKKTSSENKSKLF